MQTKPRQRIPMAERMTDCSEPLKPQDAFLTARHAGIRGHGRGGDRCGRGIRFTVSFTEQEMNLSQTQFTGAPRGHCVCIGNLFEKGNKSAVVLCSRSISYICFSSENKTSGHQKRTRIISGRGKYYKSDGLPRKRHRLNC